ncbi:MAG: hypothetical protein CUN55_13760 [Phototrophicales bacterium]|nr:MAG: hypothetical protein CUN55_13760 [Phototrophicales bacterium]
MTTQQENDNIVNLFIGVTMIVFALALAWFIFKAVLGIAPIIGVFIAIAGGISYLQAENDTQKVRALQLVIGGGILAIIFGIIF